MVAVPGDITDYGSVRDAFQGADLVSTQLVWLMCGIRSLRRPSMLLMYKVSEE